MSDPRANQRTFGERPEENLGLNEKKITKRPHTRELLKKSTTTKSWRSGIWNKWEGVGEMETFNGIGTKQKPGHKHTNKCSLWYPGQGTKIKKRKKGNKNNSLKCE